MHAISRRLLALPAVVVSAHEGTARGGVSPDGFTERLRGFRQGLKDTGHVEGENVTIEYRWAENQFDRLPVLAAELVRRRVAVIVTSGGPAAHFAAKAATTTIPIVFVVAEDPIRLGPAPRLRDPQSVKLTATGGRFNDIGFSVCVTNCRKRIARRRSNTAPTLRP